MAAPTIQSPSPAEAWAICRRVLNLSGLDLETLCRALLHAAALKVAGSARTMTDAMHPDRIMAARLFVEVQLRLTRAEPGSSALDAATIQALLTALPEGWGRALRTRLDGAPKALPSEKPDVPPPSTISEADLLTVLAIRHATSRA